MRSCAKSRAICNPRKRYTILLAVEHVQQDATKEPYPKEGFISTGREGKAGSRLSGELKFIIFNLILSRPFEILPPLWWHEHSVGVK